jgi:hypothetical protein
MVTKQNSKAKKAAAKENSKTVAKKRKEDAQKALYITRI